MEVVHATSKTCVKPFTPTPQHLRTFKISILDQLSPILYMPYVLFYHSSDDNNCADKLACLKDSMSKTLARFYPLAGRIRDSSSIDCNDEGATFVEARVNTKMSDFLRPHPKIESLNQFLPCQPLCAEPPELLAQIAVKATVFDCGGAALGICVLHKLIDGTTFSSFIKTWAAMARGNCEEGVSFGAHNLAASLFPANDRLSIAMPYLAEVTEQSQGDLKERKSVYRRFVFDSTAISSLRDNARSSQVPNPTRIEVVSGLIWKCAMNASQVASGVQTPSILSNAMNLRPRLDPPLPTHSLGNIVWRAISHYDPITTTDMGLSHLVGLLRKSLGRVDSSFLRNLQGREGHKNISEALEEERELYLGSRRPTTYAFTSLCRMGLYDADFGFGKPLWFSVAPTLETFARNGVVLVESRYGGEGIEALVILDRQEMEILEHDPEFLAYVALNPTVEP